MKFYNLGHKPFETDFKLLSNLHLFVYKITQIEFFFHLIEISQDNPLIENSLKECNILLEDRKTSWLSTISHLLQLKDLNLNSDFSELWPSDPTQIVQNKLKELYEKRFWGEISKSSRLCYL